MGVKRKAAAFVLAVAGLKAMERYAEFPYLDVGKIKTIGYGHVMKPGDPERVSPFQAENILKRDAESAWDCVIDRLPNCTEREEAALILLVFNIGCAAFSASTLLKKIRAGAPFEEIEAQWMRWVHVKGAIVPGLVNRRRKEWKVYTS